MARLNLQKVKTSHGAKTLATARDIEKLEKKHKTRLPDGYREYVTTLGDGVLSDWVRVYLPKQIDRELKPWRKRIKEYWFWDEPPKLLPKERAVECVVIADTLNGDELVFHPSDSKRLYVLPRDFERSFEAGSDFLEAIEWFFNGKLGTATKKRVFRSGDEVIADAAGAKKTPAPSVSSPATVPPVQGELLFSINKSDTKGNIECRVYLLKDNHRQSSWDGESPFDFDFRKIVQSAFDKVGPGKRAYQIEIRSTPFRKQSYYYVSVSFTPGSDLTVYLDLDGNILEPDVHKFRNYQKCDEFMQTLRQK